MFCKSRLKTETVYVEILAFKDDVIEGDIGTLPKTLAQECEKV